MPEFQYSARELSGREVSGVLTAGSEQEVLSTLSGRSLFPTKISLAQKAEKQRKAVGKRVSSRHLVIFYSQLADLLHSGVPLLRSLEVLEQQASHPTISAVLQDVRQQVSDGSPLAESLRRHPQVFGELAVSMVRAGEEGGFLEEVLKQVATFTEHQEELKARVVGAMAYPAFLMGACVLVVAGMLIFLVPKFQPIFDRLAASGELPLPTQILMAGSEFLQKYGIWVLAALIGAGWWGLKQFKTEAGRRFIDKWRLKAKGIRGLTFTFCFPLSPTDENDQRHVVPMPEGEIPIQLVFGIGTVHPNEFSRPIEGPHDVVVQQKWVAWQRRFTTRPCVVEFPTKKPAR